MMRTILEMYGLGGLSIGQIMGFPREPEREIIDVEYEDISDQIEENHQLTSEPIPEVQPILIAKDYADSDNQQMQ